MAPHGGAVGEPQVVDVAGVPVALLDARGDHLAQERDALGLGVRASAALGVVQDVARALAHVRGEQRLRLLRVEHVREVAQREDLPIKRDGLLPQALRVADVAHHDFIERVLGRVFLERRRDLARLGNDRSADGVLHVLHRGVDGVDGDAAHGADLGFRDARLETERADCGDGGGAADAGGQATRCAEQGRQGGGRKLEPEETCACVCGGAVLTQKRPYAPFAKRWAGAGGSGVPRSFFAHKTETGKSHSLPFRNESTSERRTVGGQLFGFGAFENGHFTVRCTCTSATRKREEA